MVLAAHHVWTYDDLVALPPDDLRHEIIDGEHFVSPSPSVLHQQVLGSFHLAIGLFLREQPIGKVYFAPCDVVLSAINVVVPDLLFVSRERAAILTEANLQGAPDLLIEVLSKSTRRRDRTRKLELYDRFGVREYWLADPKRQTVTVYGREGDCLERTAELSAAAGDVLATPLLPGLEIALDEIFS